MGERWRVIDEAGAVHEIEAVEEGCRRKITVRTATGTSVNYMSAQYPTSAAVAMSAGWAFIAVAEVLAPGERSREEMAAEIATLRAADDPLLDGTDGAHPAWWRGHDRAAEMLTAQRDAATDLLAEVWHEIATGRPPPVSDRTAWLAQVGDVVGAANDCAALAAARDALTREMDELRDAARAYLAARDGWELSRVLGSTAARVTLDALDAARTRLAALAGGVAVVACPACGVDITADLDDDGAYVTRRHSRRAVVGVGIGEIVWCDGGIVRTVAP
jgi:hypothetical protein